MDFDPDFPARIVAGLFAVALSLACGNLAEVSGSPEQPVIQVLLVSGTQSQIASVEYSLPANGSASDPRPVPQDSVNLFLEEPGGARVPFVPVSGSPGRFTAMNVVVPGQVYRLGGTVCGSLISAQTMVPGTLVVDLPQDTVRLPRDSFLRIDFRWHAVGASAYSIQMSNATRSSGLEFAFDTTGSFFAIPLSPNPDTSQLEIRAYDPASAGFFTTRGNTPDTPPTNIAGALGVFGSATPADHPIIFVWE